jgi:hypothetical protein
MTYTWYCTYSLKTPDDGQRDRPKHVECFSRINWEIGHLVGFTIKRLHLVPDSKQSPELVWHIPDAVCTVLNSWWWTDRPSKTWRVLFQNKLRNCASSWFYYRNISRGYVRENQVCFTECLLHKTGVSKYAFHIPPTDKTATFCQSFVPILQ